MVIYIAVGNVAAPAPQHVLVPVSVELRIRVEDIGMLLAAQSGGMVAVRVQGMAYIEEDPEQFGFVPSDEALLSLEDVTPVGLGLYPM